jgi:small subunit ribosomal protein S21
MTNNNIIKGTTVYLREGDDINRALRKFKNKVEESGKLQDLKEREFYEKPTTARKRKKSAAKARYRKQLEKEQLPKRYY